MAENGNPTEFVDDHNELSLINKVDEEVAVEEIADTTLSEKNADTKQKVSKERIRCPECHRYTAESPDQMTRHIRKVHRGENPFQCYMCDYSTYNKSLFEEHVRIHQGIKPFKCSFCSHSSASKKNLKKHELIHRPDNPLRCKICGHISRHRKGAEFHNKKFHSIEVNTHKCAQCKKNFVDLELLNRHRKGIKTCNECGYKGCSVYAMTVHKERIHGVTKNPEKNLKFKCALCPWSSNSKPRVLLHLIHHPNQTVDETEIDISVLRKHEIMV